ncbi:MAG TPA: hypothetical protein VFC34_17020, partial [Puia sp.]|nr:hypothetical protein [Puia sp.]
VYTVRPHYYVFKQLYKFVKPGFKRIDISTKLPNMVISAFLNPSDGTIVITGKNNSKQAQTLDGMLKGLSAFSSLKYYFTDEQHNFSQAPDVPVARGSFSKLIPANSVFTLVGK